VRSLHLMLAGRQQFGVLRWFPLFCFFHLVSAVCLPDKGSHFSFATRICGLVFLSLPQAFVVCFLSSFATGIYVQFLSFTAFSAEGIRVRLFVFALLALVSGYQCISQFLVSCYALAARQLHPWIFELEFFQSRLLCGQPTNSALKQTPFGIPP